VPLLINKYTEVVSKRTKEDNVMSSVPLMTLHNSKPGSDETNDSDQLSDEEDDPLEGVLARMKKRYENLFYTGYKCMTNKKIYAFE
jgi:hypothetical protein